MITQLYRLRLLFFIGFLVFIIGIVLAGPLEMRVFIFLCIAGWLMGLVTFVYIYYIGFKCSNCGKRLGRFLMSVLFSWGTEWRVEDFRYCPHCANELHLEER